MKKKQLLFISSALLIILACNIGTSTPPPAEIPNNNNSIATSVALTLVASGQIPLNPTLPTPLPASLPTMTPSPTPTLTFTPTTTLSPTPSVPMASVSEDTNCRTGPGKVYDYIGALMVGEKAEVVGKSTSHNYWVIKNPDAKGDCWLWGYYATIVGNTADLKEYAVPPTPTPSIPAAPSNFLATKICDGVFIGVYDLTADMIWLDNSNNETGFHIYVDGVIDFDVAPNVTGADATIVANQGEAHVFGVSAYNTTGESAIQTLDMTCP